MHGPEILIPLLSVGGFFAIPIFAMWSRHERKMLELRMQLKNTGEANIHAEVSALREEVRQLRDTSMQYDLSFDTALQRMEYRVQQLEQKSSETGTANVANLSR